MRWLFIGLCAKKLLTILGLIVSHKKEENFHVECEQYIHMSTRKSVGGLEHDRVFGSTSIGYAFHVEIGLRAQNTVTNLGSQEG